MIILTIIIIMFSLLWWLWLWKSKTKAKAKAKIKERIRIRNQNAKKGPSILKNKTASNASNNIEGNVTISQNNSDKFVKFDNNIRKLSYKKNVPPDMLIPDDYLIGKLKTIPEETEMDISDSNSNVFDRFKNYEIESIESLSDDENAINT